MGCEIVLVTVPRWVKPGDRFELFSVPAGVTVDSLPMQDGDITDDHVTLRFSLDDPSVPDPTITVSFGDGDEEFDRMVYGGTSDQWGK